MGPARITLTGGKISSIDPLDAPPPGKRLLAIPALVDAHNHVRPISTTSFGTALKPLETWLPNLAAMPPVDPYLASAAAFGRTASGGCIGAVGHLTRPMGPMPLPEEAQIIARAAKDVGIAVGLAVSMRDQNPLIYADHTPLIAALPVDTKSLVQDVWLAPRPSVQDQMALVEDVASALSDQPHMDVQYGPNGVQWCTTEMLEAVAEASANTGRRIHMHLLETKYQRHWADQTFPQGMVQHLADIGLLSPRITLAHCVWARPDELETIAEHGAIIASNPSSNLHLSSGIAPVEEMKAKNVSYALGLDGCAFDEDDDSLRELRLFHFLNAGWGFDDGLTCKDALNAACSTGRASVGMQPGGTIAVGQSADLLLLDLDALDRDALMQVDPRHYLLTRANQTHIVEQISGGITRCKDGTLTGLDLDAVQDELRAQYRTALKSRTPIYNAFSALEPHIQDHYKGCC